MAGGGGWWWGGARRDLKRRCIRGTLPGPSLRPHTPPWGIPSSSAATYITRKENQLPTDNFVLHGGKLHGADKASGCLCEVWGRAQFGLCDLCPSHSCKHPHPLQAGMMQQLGFWRPDDYVWRLEDDDQRSSSGTLRLGLYALVALPVVAAVVVLVGNAARRHLRSSAGWQQAGKDVGD